MKIATQPSNVKVVNAVVSNLKIKEIIAEGNNFQTQIPCKNATFTFSNNRLKVLLEGKKGGWLCP